MDLVDWSVSSVPAGLVGKQRVTNRCYCARQNRTVQVSDVYWLHGAKKDSVMQDLSSECKEDM